MKLVVLLLVFVGFMLFGAICWGEEHLDRDEKIFSMIFDLHSEEMGYQRTEQICGFGTTMAQVGYAIYKGKKHFPDKKGFIVINTNKTLKEE